MEASELRNKTEVELRQQLLEIRKEQFILRMQAGMAQLPKTHVFKNLRRSIARIKTILNQKKSA
jgi:large subunit ribosomal protein L29